MTAPDAPAAQRTVQSTRFGSLTVDETLVFEFPDGLVGFPGPRLFAMIPHSRNSPFLWLQDVDDPGLAFPVTAMELPENPAPGLLSKEERRTLSLEKGEQPRLMAVVTVSRGEVRLNRLGPLAVNIRARKGVQLVLDVPLPDTPTSAPGK